MTNRQQTITWFGDDTRLWHCRIDGLVQERRNSSVLAMELRLSCIDPSICFSYHLAAVD